MVVADGKQRTAPGRIHRGKQASSVSPASLARLDIPPGFADTSLPLSLS